jgi:prephenate dehydratase
VDANGHATDEAVAEAIQGLYRFSPKLVFLGSYPRADKKASVHEGNNDAKDYSTARRWWQKAVAK